ncbi:MAG: hypothetical protein H6601_09960 [Flavobacteriales bacterium]|nr:hypothetical protein [Flavobacteriales bacterium]
MQDGRGMDEMAGSENNSNPEKSGRKRQKVKIRYRTRVRNQNRFSDYKRKDSSKKRKGRILLFVLLGLILGSTLFTVIWTAKHQIKERKLIRDDLNQ